MSRAEVALETQRLLLDYLTVPEYAEYMTSFQADVARKGSGPGYESRGDLTNGEVFCQSEISRLKMAKPFFVAKQMMPLVKWAGAGLDNTDRFSRDLWPEDFGFLYFEEPMVSIEVWGRTVTTKAMSWGRQSANLRIGKDQYRGEAPGMVLVFYTDMEEPSDEVNKFVRQGAIEGGYLDKQLRMGNLHAHHIMFVADDERVGPAELIPPASYQQWADEDLGGGKLADATPNDRRFLLGLLMLLNQTVVKMEDEEASRPVARRARRMRLPSRVTVINLRRQVSARNYVGTSAVEWQHQWIVGHFWRWQPRGPRNAPGVAEHKHVTPNRDDTTYTVELSKKGHRILGCNVEGCEGVSVRIYINDFWKGPVDAPVKQSEKIYGLVR